MNKLTFGQYNAAFKPTRTDFDWLSRDPAEVDKYVDDPDCGFVFSAGGFADLLAGLAAVNTDRSPSRVPKDLPIHLALGRPGPGRRQRQGRAAGRRPAPPARRAGRDA